MSLATLTRKGTDSGPTAQASRLASKRRRWVPGSWRVLLEKDAFETDGVAVV